MFDQLYYDINIRNTHVYTCIYNYNVYIVDHNLRVLPINMPEMLKIQ